MQNSSANTSGYGRWLIFSATIFGAGLLLYVLWTEKFGVEVVKALVTFLVLAVVSYVLTRLARGAGASQDLDPPDKQT